MKAKFFIVAVIFSAFFNFAWAEDLNVAFVNSLVYSKNDFFAGEKIRIYGTLQNYSEFDLKGTANFFEAENFIGSFDFFVANKKSVEVWTDWKAVEGENKLSIKINNLKKLEIGKAPEQVNLEESVEVSKIKEVKAEIKEVPVKEAGSQEEKSSVLSILGDIKDNFFDTNKKNSTSTVAQASTTPASLVSNIIESSEAIIEKSKQIKDDSKIFLENKKEVIDEQILKDKKIEQAKEELKKEESTTSEAEEQKKTEGITYYTASLIGAMPNLKEAYSYILAILIFILNSWWILLGTIAVLLWLLVKMVRKRFSTNSF